jgi:aryl-alcohol dehydrogenase-like predicted oxidoreductase
MFPTLKHFSVGIIPWSPLVRGLLTCPFQSDKWTMWGDINQCVCFVTAQALLTT